MTAQSVRGITFFIFSGMALASPVTWKLANVHLSDGAVATGDFVYDASSNVVSNWNVSVSGGDMQVWPACACPGFPAFTYDPANSQAGFQQQSIFKFLEFTGPSVFNSQNRELRLAFVSDLTDAGGTVNLDLTGSNPFAPMECYNCSPGRVVISGSVTTSAAVREYTQPNLVYTLEASGTSVGSFGWSVSTPSLISETTTLHNFLLLTAPSGCTTSGATINNPFNTDVFIETFFSPPCNGFSEVAQNFFGAGPVSSPGTYTAGVPGWTLTVAAGPISIDPPTSSSTMANGVNVGGQVVGAYTNALGTHAFLQSGGAFSDIDFPSATTTVANGINDAGQIIGRYLANGQLQGFLWAGGTFTALTALVQSGGLPQAINNAGQIVGSYADGTGLFHGFLLCGDQFSSFTFGGNLITYAYGINDAGSVVGIYADAGGNQHGFLYEAGVFASIDVPGASYTNATAINNAGQIVGFYGDSAGVHGFLLKDGVFTTLDFPGTNQTQPYGISTSGQIVGVYVTNGTFHGFTTPGNSEPVSGDVNGDGHPDLIWQDPASGTSQVWFMGGALGSTRTSFAALTGPNVWRIVGVADLNGDGHPDLIWQNPVGGASQVWFMGGTQGSTVTGFAALSGPNVWRIAE